MNIFLQKQIIFILSIIISFVPSFFKSKSTLFSENFEIEVINKEIKKFNEKSFLKLENNKRNSSLNYFISPYPNKYNLINGNKDIEELVKGQFYKKIIYKDEEQKYKITVSGESNIKKIFIDVITYIGEINIILQNNLNVSQYTDINKIYLSIKVNEGTIDDITFTIKGLSNCSYIVLFNIGTEDEEDSLITNELKPGISYLVTIDPTKKEQYNVANKVVRYNVDNNVKNEIMLSFYSLNCKIIIGKTYLKEGVPIYEKIEKIFDHFSQDLVDLKNENNIDKLEYRINIIENDPSNYEGKLCKIYVSAIELSEEHNEMTKDILIPDNTPQQVMFGNKEKHVSYGYTHINYNHDLIIKLNPKHKDQYKIRIYYNYQKREKEETIVANDIIYLNSKEWIDRYKINNTFYVQLDITLEKTKYNDDPVLEFSIETATNNYVSYIPKNILKIDYIQNMNSQYYFTELGKNEEGYIIINFLRGNGNIYARIVEKNKNEKDGNWRGKYILPNKDNSITMDNFKQKLEFSTENINCEKGCYLLINVFSKVEGNNIKINRNYPFSIIVHSYPIDANSDKIPIINIPVDEYIVGTVREMFPKEFIYKFYSVWLNSDAEQVIIDFQSNLGFLFINVGNKRPSSINKADFVFLPNGKNSIFSIKKNDIFNKTNKYKYYTSLKDIVLTIGVWTNISDSVDETLFTFIVRLENDTENDIYRVNSDQKALCNTKKIKGKNKFR